MAPSRAERTLFSLTRAVALFAAVIVLILIAVALAALVRPGTSTSVTYDDILRARADSAASSGVSLSQAAQVRIPPEVSNQLQGDNESVLQAWLSNLDVGQKQDFVDGLASVIHEAEQKNPPGITAAINDYRTLKLAKFSTGTFDRYAQQARRPFLLGAILALVGGLGFLAMILVLLAIERNTRWTNLSTPG